jgi:hypothetical protein
MRDRDYFVFLQQSGQLQENFHIVISLQEQVARLQEVLSSFQEFNVNNFFSLRFTTKSFSLISGTVKAAGKRKSTLHFLH